MMVIVPSYYTK